MCIHGSISSRSVYSCKWPYIRSAEVGEFSVPSCINVFGVTQYSPILEISELLGAFFPSPDYFSWFGWLVVEVVGLLSLPSTCCIFYILCMHYFYNWGEWRPDPIDVWRNQILIGFAIHLRKLTHFYFLISAISISYPCWNQLKPF